MHNIIVYMYYCTYKIYLAGVGDYIIWPLPCIVCTSHPRGGCTCATNHASLLSMHKVAQRKWVGHNFTENEIVGMQSRCMTNDDACATSSGHT